jgi:cyanophycin synthetase
VTDKVHPQLKLLCESLARSIHAYILGVDILCQDVSKPLTIEHGGIIEMNTMPETYLNSNPVIGKQYPEIGDIVLDGLMDADIRTNKVIVIGKMNWEEIKRNMEEKLDHPGRCGRFYKNDIYINEHKINQGIPVKKAILSMKRNKSLETIILQHTSPEAIKEYGFGFNSIDLLIYKENELKDSFEKRVKELQKDNLIKTTVRY